MARPVVPIRSHSRMVAAVFALVVLLVAGGIAGEARADHSVGVPIFASVHVIGDNLVVESVSAPVTVEVGERFQLVAIVANQGGGHIMKIVATLHFPGAFSAPFAFSFVGKEESNLGAIKPFSEKERKWNLVAEEFGCQIIQVTATGIEQSTGETLVDQRTVMIAVGGAACGAAATFAEMVPNEPPVADEQSLVTEVGTPISITLTGSDPDGDALAYALMATTTHGTLEGEAPEITYTPDAGFIGGDSFTFTVSDGLAESQPAIVSITVSAANEPPMADEQSVATEENTPISITLTGSDPDGDALTYALSATTTHGTLEGVAPELTYTPDEGFIGGDSFTFTVSDGLAESQPAVVSITVSTANAPQGGSSGDGGNSGRGNSGGGGNSSGGQGNS